jgi:hypothetical protein
VLVRHASGYTVENVHVAKSSSVGIFSIDSSNGNILHNTVEGTRADGIYTTVGSHHIKVQNNLTIKTGDDAISVSSYNGDHDYTHDITIINNTVTGNWESRSITVNGGYGITISENYIDGGTVGVSVGSESVWDTRDVHDVTVTGNAILNTTYTGEGTIGGGGISLYSDVGAANLTVSGNSVYMPAHDGIFVAGTSQIQGTISNNTIFAGASTQVYVNKNVNATQIVLSNNPKLAPENYVAVAPIFGNGVNSALQLPIALNIGPPTTPTAPTTPQPVMVGSGGNTVVITVNEDSYQGDAQFSVSVDGVQIGDTQTATTAHASGQTQAFTFKGNWSTGQHTVAVNFLNDLYDGTAATDRNLYVTAISLDGTTDPTNTATLLSAGPVSFKVTAAATTPPPAAATITVNTGQTVTVPNGTYTVNMAGTRETVTAAASGANTFVFTNTSGATATIKGFKLGTDKITSARGLHDFANIPAGVDMWFDDGTHVILAGVTNATAAQIMSKTTENVIKVYGGQNVTTQPGFTDTVNIVGTGNATINANGTNDTVTCNTGTDTINVTAGNVTVKGSTGNIAFVGGGSGTATLDLKGGTTTATFGSGGASVNVAGNATFTGGLGTEIYTFTKDASIDTAVINNFNVGTDRLQLSGYGNGITGVKSITNRSAGVSIRLTDNTAITLNGVHTTTLSNFFN